MSCRGQILLALWALMAVSFLAGCAAPREERARQQAAPAALSSAQPQAVAPISIWLRKDHSGATIADDFSRPTLDTRTWEIWPGDPGVEVKVENGEARITGTTGPTKPPQYNHVVLASKVFWPADQVLVARIRAASGIDKSQAGQIFQVHLCGCTPDYHSSVSFAKVGDQIGWVRMFRYWERDSIDPLLLSPFGDEADAFHLVKIEYKQGNVRSFVEGPQGWIELGGAAANYHGVARAELKVIMSPRNFFVDMRADDCRLYLHPDLYPAFFAVNNDFRYNAKDFIAARDQDLTLKVFEKGSGKLVGEAKFDPQRGVFPVTLSREFTFPIAAEISIYRSGQVFASASIQLKGLDGLYPGDVYEIIESGSERQSQAPRPRGNQ